MFCTSLAVNGLLAARKNERGNVCPEITPLPVSGLFKMHIICLLVWYHGLRHEEPSLDMAYFLLVDFPCTMQDIQQSERSSHCLFLICGPDGIAKVSGSRAETIAAQFFVLSKNRAIQFGT